MKLYIANTTKQHLVLHYRMIEMPPNAPAYSLKIRMGGQEVIPHDLQSEDITFLLHQWRHFGLVEHSGVDRTKGFVGLSYRVEKPVTESQIERVLEHNDGAATARSEKVFQESGASLADIVAKRAAEQGTNLLQTSVSVQEDFEGKRPKNVVARGVRVTRDNTRAA